MPNYCQNELTEEINPDPECFEEVAKQPALHINNILTDNELCGIFRCGHFSDSNGLDFFHDGTTQRVCDYCAEKYAPRMVDIRNAAIKAAEGETTLGGWYGRAIQVARAVVGKNALPEEIKGQAGELIESV
jgi:hypothetical protein